MNDLLALATAVRERYLEALRGSLTAFTGEHQPSAPEVMFELQRDAARPYRLYRADMAANKDGAPIIQEVNPSTHLSFEPFGVEITEGVTAAVSPFVWNDIGIQINTTMPAEPVEDWAMKWLDLEDQSPKDEHGLQGVIHSIVREDPVDGSTLLTIDFGSAPVGALREFIELVFNAGASHVSIYSETLQ
ncbi:hypothetical protein LNV09_24605 [Paucibacter sp. B2R-40]|uniref:hypothetical protein n=1 Tax=Paucibacter sp. B2R-40 TaxID=2893554 RepID=UPI0021E4FEE7|nr:hypothetical protein [Paucibacter sp. B2R-40]MCV2357334.1 hypothetical protein [Paucibacter sp. B2R-40]